MNQPTRPTRRIDPGWLFLAAGLTVCAAGILAPAREGLEVTRRQLHRLVDERAHGEARIGAHREFLSQLEQRDPSLLRRLAASQLNLLPADQAPLLLASSTRWTIPDWIDKSVQQPAGAAVTSSQTLLGRLTSDRARLWFIAGGVLAIFTGLILDGGTNVGERRQQLVPQWRGRQVKAV